MTGGLKLASGKFGVVAAETREGFLPQSLRAAGLCIHQRFNVLPEEFLVETSVVTVETAPTMMPLEEHFDPGRRLAHEIPLNGQQEQDVVGTPAAISEESRELIHTHSCCVDQRAKCSRSNFAMLRNRKAGDLPWFHKDGVAASLPVKAPAGALESPHDFRPGKHGKARHQTGTSTSRTATVTGIPFATRASTAALRGNAHLGATARTVRVECVL